MIHVEKDMQAASGLCGKASALGLGRRRCLAFHPFPRLFIPQIPMRQSQVLFNVLWWPKRDRLAMCSDARLGALLSLLCEHSGHRPGISCSSGGSQGKALSVTVARDPVGESVASASF